MLCYGSANRDEEKFTDGMQFDVGRTSNKHLSFGFGHHVCLGQNLARLELKIFFEELILRLESVELVGDAVMGPSTFVNGLKKLPIRFQLKAA